jgi:hypothetical protein
VDQLIGDAHGASAPSARCIGGTCRRLPQGGRRAQTLLSVRRVRARRGGYRVCGVTRLAPLLPFTAKKPHYKDGVPTGIRTPVTAVKGRCPRPLDDGD